MKLGDRIRKRLDELDLSQEALGKMSGMSQVAINKIISGNTKNPRKILELAKALEVDPNWLKTGDNLKLISVDKNPYKHSLDFDKVVKCFTFIDKEINYGVLHDEGNEWSADIFIKLYDLYSDPGAEGLNTETILKIIM